MTQNYLVGFVPKVITKAQNKFWLYRLLDKLPKYKGFIDWMAHPKPIYNIDNHKIFYKVYLL